METSTSNNDLPVVSVIVPTACELKRAVLIKKAIDSITNQEGVSLDIIIIVNGNRYDRSVLQQLKANPKLKVLQLAEGNVSAARYVGVLKAAGEFFCFLDDDDEFLPGAMQKRVALLLRHQDVDVLVTNGYVRGDSDLPLVGNSLGAQINSDPASSFLSTNWFASPASTFRAKTIESGLFDIRHKYFEWTYLFFLLLSNGKRIRYDHCITYRINAGNPLSVSKSKEYLLEYSEFLFTLQRLPLERRIRKALAQRYLSSLNSGSNLHLEQGDLRGAWTSHLKCLTNGGWRFLPYTRHLILAGLRSLRG